MNDRYLYRAKRTDNGEWAEGTLLHKSSSFSVECDEYYIFDGIETSSNDDLYLVDPSTICQCTGLEDKNGKMIWENDIVNVNTNKGNTLCEVRYADSVAQFQLWQLKTLPKTSTVLNLGNYEEEVCGNIFDNPELLEVGE